MSAADTKECPFCAETIKAAAVLCRFCGRDLPSAGTSAEPAQPGSPDAPGGPSASPRQIEKPEIFDLLTALVEKSLVVYEEDERGHGRYRLLETVRQYSSDRLVEADSSETPRDRHLQFCLRMAEEAEPRLRSFEQKAWAARLESEHDNLRAALEWAIARDPEAALRLAGALWWFWYWSGHAGEGRDWLERALARERVPRRSAVELARAKALLGWGHFASEQGEPEIGRAHLEESLAIYRKREDLPGCVLALGLLAIFIVVESPAAARALAEESLALARRLDEPWYLGWALLLLGEVARAEGDLEPAAAYYGEAADALRRSGEGYLLGCSLHNLGCVRLHQGDASRARALFEESLVLFREQASVVGIANCLASLARSSVLERQPARAARLFGAVEELFDSIGQKLQPVDQSEFDHSVASVRTLMPEDALRAVWAEGREMSLQQAIEYALQPEEQTA